MKVWEPIRVDAGAISGKPGGAVIQASSLYFLLGMFVYIPKDFQGIVGSGGFNVGVIDLLAATCIVRVLQIQGLSFRFLNRADRNLITAFVLCVTFSIFFSPYPYFGIKSIAKVVEAVFLYLALIGTSETGRKYLYRGLFFGGLLSIFLINRDSTDSKVSSAAFMLSSFYFLLQYLDGRQRQKENILSNAWFAGFFFVLAFLVYPKKGAIFAYLLACIFLWVFGLLRFRVKTLIAVSVVVFAAGLLAVSNESFLRQFTDTQTFVTQEGEGDPRSLILRFLQFLVIPSLLMSGRILGYGYSQSPAGIDTNIYNLIAETSQRVFGFVPDRVVFRVGSNFFSDNLFFTMIAELGWMNLVVACFLAGSLWFYYRKSKVTCAYIAYVLLMSLSMIDLFIYRGTNIFFLNAMFFPLVAGAHKAG